MIVIAGEALVDLVPRGEVLEPTLGGSPCNVAVGLGRLGTDAAFLGGLSRDGFGQRLSERLARDGVELGLTVPSDAPTTLAVVHLDDQARASYGFYLEATAAAALTPDLVPSLPDGAPLHVSFGAVTLDTRPAGATLAGLLDAERGRRLLSVDPNVRPTVIVDVAAYATRMDALVAGVDLVKVSDEDLHLLHPDRDPLEVARGWAGTGPDLVVVTRGPRGAIAFRPQGAPTEVPGVPVDVVDTVGAGDAFTAGLLAAFDGQDRLHPGGLAQLTDDDLAAALDQAVRVAALTCGRAGADPPRLDER
jgi:fructokinase